MSDRLPVYGTTRPQLRKQMVEWGFRAVHAERLWSYLYQEKVRAWDELPELPRALVTMLREKAELTLPQVVAAHDSSDGFTRKFLLGLEDEERIETVRMYFSGRVTACVSSQVGCAMGCVFCATGQQGFGRNLSAAEIVAQAMHVTRSLRESAPAEENIPASERLAALRLRNVVLMGMGEPLHNYDAVITAVEILCDDAGISLAGRRITLSTVGVVPGILRLAQENRPCHLAVSLHAATQEERAVLVPVARKWPLDELMTACREYSAKTGRRIFYEWTLIAGKNDRPQDARAVGNLLRGLPAQVNLIPLNLTEGYAGVPAVASSAREFQRILADEFSLPSTVRQRRGLDIAAGCGQLAASA